MFNDYNFSVAERFLRYVQIDTQSDPKSMTHPSTSKQLNLSVLLADELKAMGIEEVSTDVYGYVYAHLPSNTTQIVPVVCFCSHIDTAPDCSGTNVKPMVHHAYNGADIILPDDNTQVIRIADHPYLKTQIGHTIITASGLTLLGADDKSGVAIIMDMAQYLMTHPEIKHGGIKILFTPDEEVGQGTAMLDLNKLSADVAYTLDGGALGTFEDETFSADLVTITFHGISAHPGAAKNKMINALKIGGALLAALPQTEWCPEMTEHREGFVHPVRMEGGAEQAVVEFIIRDFETAQLAVYESRLKQIAENVLTNFPGAKMEFVVEEQYRNMKEVISKFPAVSKYAKEAYEKAGLKLIQEPIRGGTDGSRLTFMGLPCPNIFTGMQAIHSRQEWIGVKDMEKAVEVLVNLVQVWETHAYGD